MSFLSSSYMMFTKETACSRWCSCRTKELPSAGLAERLQGRDLEEFKHNEQWLQVLKEAVDMIRFALGRSIWLKYAKFVKMDEAGSRQLISSYLNEMIRKRDLESREEMKATVKG